MGNRKKLRSTENRMRRSNIIGEGRGLKIFLFFFPEFFKETQIFKLKDITNI